MDGGMHGRHNYFVAYREIGYIIYLCPYIVAFYTSECYCIALILITTCSYREALIMVKSKSVFTFTP